MIELVIFDLDGVICNTKMIHFRSLNDAITAVCGGQRFCISKEEHLSRYDGLTTKKKLDMLTQEKGLPANLHDDIWKKKQQVTAESIIKYIKVEQSKVDLFNILSGKCKIVVATNAIKSTTEMILEHMSLLSYIDRVYSNTDVKNNKPHPEIYMKAMSDMGVRPQNTLIIEDSIHGINAAAESGANLLIVKNEKEVTWNLVKEELKKLDSQTNTPKKLLRKKLNIVIPMAGAGSRFEKAGYTFPKPLVETIDGKPMIQLVIESLNIDANYIYLVNKEHYVKYSLKYLLNLITPGCSIIEVDGITEGAACTTLLARTLIDNDEELLISNSDQFIKWNNNQFFYIMNNSEVDGAILTFHNTHPKWSYVKIEEDGFISEVAEKKPISTNASVGIYYWKKGSDYVKYADQMIKKDIRVGQSFNGKGEFYTCPVYNEAIEDGKGIIAFKVEEMHGLGTPEDLNTFLSSTKRL